MSVKHMNSKQDPKIFHNTLEQGYKELKPDHEYYVICHGGVRSASTCQFLSSQGLTVTNVEGGMNAWPGQVE